MRIGEKVEKGRWKWLKMKNKGVGGWWKEKKGVNLRSGKKEE